MHAQAQLPEDQAREDELKHVHNSGPHIGTFFVTGPNLLDSDTYIRKVDGKPDDFSLYYIAALDALMDQDERVRNGHAFRISIC